MSSFDQQLDVSQDAIAKLNELRAQTKFVSMPGTLYSGMRPEIKRLRAEGLINALIDRLLEGLPSKPSKNFTLDGFSRTMAEFPEFQLMDTDDRERFLNYFEEIMDILGIASSDGLLNGWMYGPILGPIIDRAANKKTTP
jgi:hypothetical protein